MTDAAPFVAFDSVKAYGICRQSGTIALTAVRFAQAKTDAEGREVIIPDEALVAHLRGDLLAFQTLRSAINEVERLFLARDQIAAAEAAAGQDTGSMQ